MIEDSVNFQNNIIFDLDWTQSTYQNVFTISKLNFDTKKSKAFIEKIYKDFSNRYESLKNYIENGVPIEMTGFLGAGNNPMVGMTVSVAVAVEESLK